MNLDAQAFEPVLTPEAALGIIQKSIRTKRWEKYEVTDIKLVYTPFWVFSFDILGQAGQSGKTSLNAYSGEVNEFIPMLLERPLKKTRSTQSGVESEVEPTTIADKEVKEVAQTKIMAQLGVKKDDVAVSAFTKIYVPTFRIWVDVAGDTHRIDLDASLGIPTGLEAIPERPKTWTESTSETLDKMKSPQGLIELTSGTVGGVAKDKPNRNVLLIIAIIILAAVIFIKPFGGSANISCTLNEDYLGKPVFFGLGTRPIEPAQRARTLLVKGECSIANPTNEEQIVLVQTKITDKKTNEILAMGIINARPPKQTTTPTTKKFELNWTDTGAMEYEFKYEKI